MMTALSLFTTSAALTTAALISFTLYIRHLHASLRAQTNHRKISVAVRKQLAASHVLESLPQDLLDRPEKYRIVHERDSIRLLDAPATSISATTGSLDGLNQIDAADLFTRLMRRNMTAFATWLPQSWFMRLLARTAEQKRSFASSHIQALDFQEGDVACGFYEVLVRKKVRCEMGIASGSVPIKGLPRSFGGRLVTSIVSERADGGEEEVVERERGGTGTRLQTETLQWVERREAEGTGFVLPLERGLVRWMHELASWGLLVGGRKWLLEEIARTKREKVT